MAALHEDAGASDRDRLLDLLVDHRLREQVALALVPRPPVERAEVAVGHADVRVVEIPIDDERHARRVVQPVADLVRHAPHGHEIPRTQEGDRLLVRDALAAERLLEHLVDHRGRRRDDRHAGTSSRTKRSSGTCGSSPDVAGHLEERVEAGSLARPEAVAELLEVAGHEPLRIAVRLTGLLREPLGLGASEADGRDERVLELDEPVDDRLRSGPDREDHGEPRPFEPEPTEVEVRRRILEGAP